MPKGSKLAVFLVVVVILSGFFNFNPAMTGKAANGASLYLSPATGGFAVGSTFTTSIVLNTNGQFINAVDIGISYPPDKLQIVSPSLGTSIISIWTSQPHFDNQKGEISFQGGIPNPGIRTDRGIVATITFRVKSVGQALVRLSRDSKVLLNDGLATDVLTETGSAIYDLALPPPRGPIVVSETHSDQNRWYKNNTVVLRWTNTSGPVNGYSYVLSDEPIGIPDDISEGADRNSVTYKSVADGTRFFHIKALRDGAWGETSHFAVNVDVGPPADFSIEISPSSRTSNHRPLINFFTTDTLSGLDHYEINLVSRDVSPSNASPKSQPFFIEASSPYSPELGLGRYDVIVRAYDKAGNAREVTKRLTIVTPFLQLIGFAFLPRWAMALFWLLLFLVLAYVAYRLWRWHRRIHLQHLVGAINNPAIAERLQQLQAKKSEYLKHLVVLLALCLSVFLGSGSAFAAGQIKGPPIVTTVSKNITNEEIFYIGGKTLVPGSEVIIYTQSLHDGQTLSTTVIADQKGDWFYTHPDFLSAGRYLVWTQNKSGQELSAPSAQYDINVAQTALQFGVSRLSFETLYLIFVIILFIALAGVIGFIIYHGYHGTKKKKKMISEVLEAEEAIKRGFLILRRDIQAELSVIHKNKTVAPLSTEDAEKETRLVRDLEWVSQYIEKEVRDIERLIGF